MSPFSSEVSTSSVRAGSSRSDRVALPISTRLTEHFTFEARRGLEPQGLTVLTAPTGYSKTRTVRAWLTHLDTGGVDTAWVDCKPGSAETLWQTIVSELAIHSSAAPGTHESPEQRALLFAERVRRPLVLVLDDYHHATSAENDLALISLSNASPMLTLLVATRRSTLLESALVSARTRVRIIGTRDLALTSEETQELAYSLGIPRTIGLDDALERTAGWPLAVRAALGVGFENFYAEHAYQADRGTDSAGAACDPIENLDAFALDHLKLIGPDARSVLLAAAQLDAISSSHISSILPSLPAAQHDRSTVITNELLDLGLFIRVPGSGEEEFKCHPSVEQPLATLAHRTTPLGERTPLYRYRAAEIRSTAPLTAFTLLCAAEDFSQAEEILACSFTVFTDENERFSRVLNGISEELLRAHPTFIAALLFLKIPNTTIASATIEYLASTWGKSLELRLANESAATENIMYLPLLFQSMIAARIGGRLDLAGTLLRQIEGRLIPAYLSDGSDHGSPFTQLSKYSGSLPTYFREVAATALMVGDFESARRNLARLKDLSERRLAKPWRGFPRGSTRTVTDPESASGWLLTAFGESAFTEALDGDIRASERFLAEYDALAEHSGATAPGISWAGAELARAHLSYELDDPTLFRTAQERLSPLFGRLETLPLLLIAEAAVHREERGQKYALTQLQGSLAEQMAATSIGGRWGALAHTYQIMLATTVGNFQLAERLLETSPPDTTLTTLELARRALFTGDHVRALLLTEEVSDRATTKREQLDRCLIAAVAAWNNDQQEVAFTAFDRAAALIEKFGHASKLLNVPYKSLHALAQSARAAGRSDLVERVEAIPVHARPRSYGRLTEMELKTLITVAEHRTTNDAAAALFLTPGTVKKHLASVYRKLGVNGRDEAILTAGRMGLFDARG